MVEIYKSPSIIDRESDILIQNAERQRLLVWKFPTYLIKFQRLLVCVFPGNNGQFSNSIVFPLLNFISDHDLRVCPWMPTLIGVITCNSIDRMKKSIRTIITIIWPKKVYIHSIPDSSCAFGLSSNENSTQRGWFSDIRRYATNCPGIF